MASTTTRTRPARAGTGTGCPLRRVALWVVYALLGAWGLLMAQPVLWVVADILPTDELAWAAGVSTGWKLLAFAPALVVLATTGRSVVAVQMLSISLAALVVMDLVVPQSDPPLAWWQVLLTVVVQQLLWVGPWLLLSPQRRRFLHVAPERDAGLLALAALAVPLHAVWAFAQTGLPALAVRPPVLQEARGSVVSLAVVLAVLTTFSALRPSGRRWPALAVAAATAWVGAWSVALPDLWGSPGRACGALMLAWAAAYGLRASLRPAHAPHAPGAHPSPRPVPIA